MNPQIASHLFQEELYRFSSAVAIVLPRAWNTYSADEQQLLKKILTSVKVDIHSVLILVQPAVNLTAVRNYTPERVLIFGSETSDDIPLYKATPAQGFMVIRADDLSFLDEQKKKNLWLSLRQMFAV